MKTGSALKKGGDGVGVLGAFGDDGGYFLWGAESVGVEAMMIISSDGWWLSLCLPEEASRIVFSLFVGGLAGGCCAVLKYVW